MRGSICQVNSSTAPSLCKFSSCVFIEVVEGFGVFLICMCPTISMFNVASAKHSTKIKLAMLLKSLFFQMASFS